MVLAGPWINNCVGFRNWPHFMRFLFYTVATTAYLQYKLLEKCWGIFGWLWPLGRNRKVGEHVRDGGGLRYEVNGFEKPWLVWPPPDPEKFGFRERARRTEELKRGPWTMDGVEIDNVEAFRRRQRE